MLSMFLETQREIDQLRADAEAEAQEILAMAAHSPRDRRSGDDEFLAYLRGAAVSE